jgi:predicted nucleic acid-binding protein
MPDEPRLIYWDSNCFTSYINEYPDRLPALEAILDDAHRSSGKLVIVTSVLSKVEVAFSLEEQVHRALVADEEARIANLWADTSVIKLIEVHELIIDDARKLIRAAMTSGLSLKAADAIHLASAVSVGAREFETYDDKLYNPHYASETALIIRAPTTAQPRLPGA